MAFIDQWREQAKASLIECANIAPTSKDMDLKFRLMVVGVLWPIREPVQDFDLEAMEAIQEIVGDKAKFVMQLVQNWGDDHLAVAQSLTTKTLQGGELGAALSSLVSYFEAFTIFANSIADPTQTTPSATTPFTESEIINPRVLVIYVRGDGEAMALELYQRLQVEGIPTWRDIAQAVSAPDWWQRVTQALDQVDFLVLAMTPAAAASQMIRKLWRYAHQHDVCIYPILKEPDLDFDAMPRWMRQVHFYNLNLEWTKLATNLKGDCHPHRPPFMADPLPETFINRPAQLKQLTDYLYDAEREEGTTNTVALVGAGGYGKTTLVTAICHNENIRQVFDNGILWVTLSENTGDLIRYVIDLIEVLSGERPGFSGLDAAAVRFGELLADRDVLLVIDDVWNAAYLKPFLQGGSRCARIITTRDLATLPPDTKVIEVGAMRPDEATALLTKDLPFDKLDQAQQLANRLGEWPLLLKLANGVLRDRVHKGHQSVAQALNYAVDALNKHGVSAFDVDDPEARHQAVSQTIEVSLELLNTERRTRYFELALFPEDINIPLNAVEMLWAATGNFDDFDTEELVDQLHELSLLQHVDLSNRTLRMHKMMHSYLLYQQGEQITNLHNRFLELQAVDSWALLPPEDLYLWTHLAHHLVGAKRTDELLNTVKDLHYLAVKTQLRGAHYTESDLHLAETVAPQDSSLRAFRRTLSQTSHLLARCTSKDQIINTLHSRLTHLPELAEIIDRAEPTLPRPLLTARHVLPDLPDPRLIRTLRGHTTGVLDCALSADGSTIVSIGKDSDLVVWDTDSGIIRFNLMEQNAEIWGCDISAGGSTVIYTTSDGRLVVWDVPSESQQTAWTAHQVGAIDCALSADGSTAVTTSKDKTLKVWDIPTGEERFTLTGHQRTVTSCDISADGKIIISTSNDGTVRLWDAQSGQERFVAQIRAAEMGLDRLTFSRQRDIHFKCAMSADGTTIAVASSGGTVTLWDVDTGTERLALSGDKRGLQQCALNVDGSVVVCAFANGSVKVWDTNTGAEIMHLGDHSRAVNSCAISNNGSIIVSGSDDQTLKVWDGQSRGKRELTSGRIGAAQRCAISADGTVAVSAMADNTLLVWDVPAGTEQQTLKQHTRKINDCVITPDGTTIVSASQDQTLIVWDAQSGRQRQVLASHTWAVNGCAISADAATVVSASDDKTIKIWDARSGTERQSIVAHRRQVNHCAISADGRIAVSASGDGTLRVWDVHTGQKLATLHGHSAWVDGCAISADGSVIVSASYDKTLKIWDAHDFTERATLEGHTMTVSGCAISADGGLIISASRDKTLKVWDARSGHCLTTLLVDDPLLDCACSADATAIIAVGNSGVYFLRLVQ